MVITFGTAASAVAVLQVVFGQLISGSEVLSRIEKEGTESGSPRHHVQIYNW